MILKSSSTNWDISHDNLSQIMNFLNSNKKKLYFLEGDERYQEYFLKYNTHKKMNGLKFCSTDSGYHFVKYKEGYFVDKKFLENFNIIRNLKRRS